MPGRTMSEVSEGSRDGTLDSSRGPASSGGEKEVPPVMTSEQFQSTHTQRSVTTDTEESFFGDTSGENPFNLEMTEVYQDPKLVNIHQFFPALEQNFVRAVSGRLGEDRQALRAIAEEDNASASNTADGSQTETGSHGAQTYTRSEGQTASSTGDGTWKAEDRTTASSETDTQGESQADGQREFVSTSGTDSTRQGLAPDDALVPDHQLLRMYLPKKAQQETKGGIFATTVDEETLAAAQERRQGAFTHDDWSSVKQNAVSLTAITTARAYQHYQRAMQLAGEGKFVEVITCLNKAVTLKGDEAAFYRQRGEAYVQICDMQSAILNYKKACLLAGDKDASSFRRLTFLFYLHGQCLFDQRLYPEALEAFSRAAEMDPDNVGYHIRSISCLAALQRHGECLALVNKRLEVDHDNPDLYIMRARLHEMFRNTTLCYYDVKDALALEGDHPEATTMMASLERKATECKMAAMTLNIAGKHREALQKISIAIETNPSVADFHVLRGALHRKLNDFNAAIDDFLLALDKCDHSEDTPTYSSAQRQLLLTYNDFAVECFTKGYYSEAIILLNKALKGEKGEKGLYINRGDCFFKQEELTFALQDYLQALELDQSDANVGARISVIHNEFGVKLYQEKNYIDAEAKFSMALQYNPHVGQYYISRSRARYMLENMSGARSDLLLGLLLDPTNEDILSILARLFPGKSVADVINSPAAQASRDALQTIGPGGLIGAFSMASMQGSLPLALPAPAAAAEPMWCPPGGPPPLALCLQEQEFNAVMVTQKKKVEVDVKDALINRKSLRHGGARIQPLPPSAPHPRFGSQMRPRVSVTAPTAVRKKGAYNWRTFSLGIGLQDS